MQDAAPDACPSQWVHMAHAAVQPQCVLRTKYKRNLKNSAEEKGSWSQQPNLVLASLKLYSFELKPRMPLGILLFGNSVIP